jgi:hypothetical protein
MNEGAVSESLPAAAVQARPSRLSLPPKGSCWYCEKPVDSVRRFCGKKRNTRAKQAARPHLSA